LRARAAFRVGFVVFRFIAVVAALPVLATVRVFPLTVFPLPVVLSDVRVVAVFAFAAAFALTFDGADLLTFLFVVTGDA
jgi:hypothetical protein